MSKKRKILSNNAQIYESELVIKRKVRQDLKTENSAEGTALLNAGGIK